MKPRHAMLIGAAFGLSLVAVAIFVAMPAGALTAMFACGALFGKGYGVWEERSRLSPEAPASSKEEGDGR